MSSRHLNDIAPVTRLERDFLVETARRLGFHAVGMVPLRAVDAAVADGFRQWIQDGNNAGMAYLANYADKRLDPRKLMPEAKSMICLAMSYSPDSAFPLSPEGYDIASYALGADYHDVVKRRMQALADALGLKLFRVFCDTAPILERYWAWQTGIGWIGRNHQLIVPDAGSHFFLGEIITDSECAACDTPMPSRCGSCRKCIEACPTGALDGVFDARLCLSYQTIENRGDIPPQIKDKLGNCIYGCDRCQKACPHNRRAVPSPIEEFRPSAELRSMTRKDWHALTPEHYRLLFKKSAVKRVKYEGLMRNINAVADCQVNREKRNGDDEEQ